MKSLRIGAAFVAIFISGAILAPSALAVNEWVPIALPPHVEYFTVMEAGSDYLFAAMVDSSGSDLGLFRTALDAPGSWEHLGLAGLSIRGIVIGGDDDTHLLVGASGNPLIHRSTNGGLTWEAASSGITLDRFIAMDGNGLFPGRVYVSAKLDPYGDEAGVYVSSDFGDSWDYWLQCSPCGTSGMIFLGVPQHHPTLAWAMDYNDYWILKPWVTDNGGALWEAASVYGHEVVPRDFGVAANNPLSIFLLASYCGMNWVNGGEAIFYGTPFHGANANLALVLPTWDDNHQYVLGVDPSGAAGVAFAAEPWTDWGNISVGLPDYPLPAIQNYARRFLLEPAKARPVLFASLWSLGLHMCDLGDMAGVPEASSVEVRLSGPRPNPATTRVSCALGGSLNSSLQAAIVDPTGRLVRQLAPGPVLTWDCRGKDGRQVPAGVYYFRVADQDGVAQRPVLVVR